MLNLPNILTAINLWAGIMAVYLISHGLFLDAFYWTCLSLAADFFDGFAARKLNITTSIGKELDSLADVISFGLVPGLLMFQFISLLLGVYLLPIHERSFSANVLTQSGWLITIFSAFRLAKFNLDNTQTTSFKGMPTPANTILIYSLVLFLNEELGFNRADLINYAERSDVLPFYLHPAWYVLISCALAYFLVSDMRLMALKFNDKDGINNYRYLMIGCASVFLGIGLISGFLFGSLLLLMIFYVILSLYIYQIKRL